ncbi:MAG: PD40 domain-containing protein [Anaerolineales bacterium]|nr:PD40 domain-containing protein [Anaerolineales bacterium]
MRPSPAPTPSAAPTECSTPNPSTLPVAAGQVAIPVEGSLQNPAWSPEGVRLMFTRFSGGYNRGPADILIYDLRDHSLRVLVSDGSDNVNLPGSAWNAATSRIVFSSSREPHDEIYWIAEDGGPGEEIRITDRADRMAYEPSLSPDGVRVVFESHRLDAEDNGVITVFAVDGSDPYRALTDPQEDCRQPNWSPAGGRIVYQRFDGTQWDLWVVNADGSDRRRITGGDGDKTDASFSPDGEWIVFSVEEPDGGSVNLFVISVSGGDPIQTTRVSGYAGAPSWSPDGKYLAFEYSPADPDRSPGTAIWIVAAPTLPV